MESGEQEWRDALAAWQQQIAGITTEYTKALTERLALLQRSLGGLDGIAQLATAIQGTIASQTKSVTALHQVLAPWLKQITEEQQRLWGDFSKTFAEAMRRTHDALERVELLAEVGWTLPTEMSIPQANALLMQDELTPEDVDRWFVQYYRSRDAEEYRSLKEYLISSPYLVFWKPLVQQATSAFERGDYAICVPTLLLVLEGSIAVPWGVKFQSERERQKFFNRRIDAVKPASIMGYVWKSVAAFVDTVFETNVSPKADHVVPKRNLILHGKSDPSKWDEADCLRLFQALSTVLFVRDELAANSSESPNSGASK